jgi:hypothetical protein
MLLFGLISESGISGIVCIHTDSISIARTDPEFNGTRHAVVSVFYSTCTKEKLTMS